MLITYSLLIVQCCSTFRYTPVPDSVLNQNRAMGETTTAVDKREQKFGGLNSPFPGVMTPGFGTPSGESRICLTFCLLFMLIWFETRSALLEAVASGFL